jgi:uncharacterized phage-associated protein
MNRIDNRKIIQALNCFAQHQGDKTISKMKVYKLLWLADRYHLRQYGRTITGDTYYALPLGLVPSDAKNILEEKSTKFPVNRGEISAYLAILDKNNYKSLKETNLKVFSKTDIKVINLILDTFNDRDQFELSEYSHLFPEWKRFEESLNSKDEPNGFKVNMDDFFKNVDEESSLFSDDKELLELSKQVYQEISL